MGSLAGGSERLNLDSIQGPMAVDIELDEIDVESGGKANPSSAPEHPIDLIIAANGDGHRLVKGSKGSKERVKVVQGEDGKGCTEHGLPGICVDTAFADGDLEGDAIAKFSDFLILSTNFVSQAPHTSVDNDAGIADWEESLI
ncbi:MAG: hypothetical protein R3C28_29350 [Pirellulaceae bacterium]